jgi:N6-L-threonylcarbamoyladenine synthase
MKHYLTLGIETSCDETAAAVYDSERGILSNKLFSQIDLHRIYGGVVPEVASRSHLEKINLIVQEALDAAGVKLEDIDNIAVTSNPGLAGSLLVGLCFAKGIASFDSAQDERGKKLIGVNHLEGHAFSAFLEYDIPFPHLCLTASGGHTALYLVRDFGDYQVIGQTLDDAAGEAFDKVAKLINLPYPGGPVIEKLAREMEFKDFFNYPRNKDIGLDFSFSGLKTAVLYDLVKRNAYSMETKKFTQPDNEQLKKEVASSLLVCIADIFEQKLERAFAQYPHVKAFTFVGGVACNKYIKERLRILAEKRSKAFFSPSGQYCTDNAAMIALVGNYKAKQGKFSDLSLDVFESV